MLCALQGAGRVELQQQHVVGRQIRSSKGPAAAATDHPQEFPAYPVPVVDDDARIVPHRSRLSQARQHLTASGSPEQQRALRFRRGLAPGADVTFAERDGQHDAAGQGQQEQQQAHEDHRRSF